MVVNLSFMKKIKQKLKQTPDHVYTIASLAALAAVNYAIIHNSFVFIAVIVLLAHELGHYFTAKSKNIEVNLPIFIPLPFLGIGLTKVGFQTAEDQQAIAISGPIYGFITALLILLLNILYNFTSNLPIIFLAITELVFNFIGSDGKKYREARRRNASCI